MNRFPILIGVIVGAIFGSSLVLLIQEAALQDQASRNHGNFVNPLGDGGMRSSLLLDKHNLTLGARIDENKIRVLCWILTSPENHATSAKAVKETWGKRCDILLFMSTKEDANLPAIKLEVEEGYDFLWGKTREALRYVWNNYKDRVDWFYKADDDTYAIMENMRYFLSAYNTSKPVWFGYKFKKFVKQGFFGGGSGYVLSKEAARRFAEDGYNNPLLCNEDHQGSEDVEMGICLSNLNVSAMDTRDSKGRERFLQRPLEEHIFMGDINPDYWFWNYIYYPVKNGLECCSDTAIAFHYVNIQQMYMMEYLSHQLLIPFGRKAEFSPSTPEPPPDLELTATPWSIPDEYINKDTIIETTTDDDREMTSESPSELTTTAPTTYQQDNSNSEQSTENENDSSVGLS